MREIVLDTETTGFDPNDGHRLVEIGCVELYQQIPTGKTFHKYINPERDMPEEAFRVHGLSEEFLSDQPLFSEVADDFVEFIGTAPMIIHNAEFDMNFINAELRWLKKPELPMEQAVDTLMMARKKFPGAPATLDALCRRFDIDNSNRTLHGALLDSELLAEVYLELLGGRQHGLSFAGDNQHDKKKDDNANLTSLTNQNKGELREARKFPIPEDELKAHEELLEKIDNPLWNTDTKQQS